VRAQRVAAEKRGGGQKTVGKRRAERPHGEAASAANAPMLAAMAATRVATLLPMITQHFRRAFERVGRAATGAVEASTPLPVEASLKEHPNAGGYGKRRKFVVLTSDACILLAAAQAEGATNTDAATLAAKVVAELGDMTLPSGVHPKAHMTGFVNFYCALPTVALEAVAKKQCA
jgi:hypothetical protein